MKKKSLEPVYRTPDGGRWRFLEKGKGVFEGCNLMTRVKDGHRLYWPVEKLKLETT